LAGWSFFWLASRPAQAGPQASRFVSDFTLHDYRGKQVSMSDFSESKLVVLAFLGTECPLAKLYAARLEEIARGYGNDQVAVIGLIANVQDNGQRFRVK
jgi:peroxiredoxin